MFIEARPRSHFIKLREERHVMHLVAGPEHAAPNGAQFVQALTINMALLTELSRARR